MKAKFYHPFLFFLFISNLSQHTYCQNKIRLHSVATGFGGFYINKAQTEGGGISFTLNGTLEINKNLVNLSYLTGAEIGIIDSSTYNFNELSIAYGKELQLANWFSFEGFVGIGNYRQNSNYNNLYSGNSISFPVKLNTKFFFNNKIGIELNNTYSINLILHYKF